MADFNKRIPELDPLELITANGLLAWYDPATNKTYRVSVGALKGDIVDAGAAWNPDGTYSQGDTATFGGVIWLSEADENKGNPPGPASLFWTAQAPPEPSTGEPKFTEDITVRLSAGKSFGKYINGQVIPAAGKTAREVILMALDEYINAVFTLFNIDGQNNIVEVGTTIVGDKTFQWAITDNSGDVDTLDIFDVTEGLTLVAGLPAVPAFAIQAIPAKQLNANGAAQAWQAIGYDLNSGGAAVNSGTFTVTARYLRFAGPVAAIPADSAAVRALPSTFQTGPGTFILNTGSVEKIFAVLLPPGFTISVAFDLDALNAPLNYALVDTRNVDDAGATPRVYNLFVLENAVPYSASHRHEITVINA